MQLVSRHGSNSFQSVSRLGRAQAHTNMSKCIFTAMYQVVRVSECLLLLS